MRVKKQRTMNRDGLTVVNLDSAITEISNMISKAPRLVAKCLPCRTLTKKEVAELNRLLKKEEL